MERVVSGGLKETAQRYGVVLADETAATLESYCRLLWDWNAKINLTRHADFEKFASRDLVDCAALCRFIEKGENVLDVGSGGGVPGVVLALLRPDLRVTVCESVGKKAKVLEDIIGRLSLPVRHRHARAEDLLKGGEGERFSTLTVRAVAKMKKLLGWFNPYWDRFDRLLLVKGPGWVEERAEARHFGHLGKAIALRKLDEYPLRGTDANGVILQLCPKSRLLGEPWKLRNECAD